MANEKHLLLTIQGDWNDSNLTEEAWQVGIRLVLNAGGGIDPIGTLPNNWNPVAETISRTETNWTITGNWRVDFGSGVFFNPDDYLNDQVAPQIGTWLSSSSLSNRCRVRRLRLYPIGTDGHAIPAPPYGSGTPCLLEWTSSFPVGGNAGNLLPLQCAAVMSHRTQQIGRAGRGRIYRPGLTAGSVDADGKLDSSVKANMLSSHVTLLENIALVDAVAPKVETRPIVTGGTFTQYAVINQVRVNDIVDTQRRRTRQITPVESSASVSY